MTLVVKQVLDYTFVVTDLNAKLNLLAKSNDFVKGFYMIIFLIYIFINALIVSMCIMKIGEKKCFDVQKCITKSNYFCLKHKQRVCVKC